MGYSREKLTLKLITYASEALVHRIKLHVRLRIWRTARGGGKAPMPELDIPAEFLQKMSSQATKDLPNVSEERAKELDDIMMRMTETDWLNLMMQVGSNPALARELLGADVTEENFVERMTAIKDKKKRALADLRYRALKAVKAMSKQQLIEEYENICRRLEKDRLLSAQYNLFRPKPAISEPPSKRQRVARASSQPSNVPAATTQPADDHDSAGGKYFHASDSTVSTSAAMDSAGSHRESGVSPFADSADSSSPSPVSTDHIPIDVLFESTSGGITEFFLDSDEDEQIGMSRVAADPDSDDEVLAEIIFRGQSISGHGVVVVDKLPMNEIVDHGLRSETVSAYASSPPRSRRKHHGVRSDDFLWDKPVEDFFSSESESDDDMEKSILLFVWCISKDCENFCYLHVIVRSGDLLLLRRCMSRYFRLNPDVDVGLDLWRDVNLLCQSLHSDDVEDFWRTQDDWIVSSWKLYTGFNKGEDFPPSYCRDVVVAGSVIQMVQAGLRESYECLASAPLVVSRWHVSSSILLISLLVSHVLVSASTEIGIADYVSAGMFSFSADRDSNLLIVILDYPVIHHPPQETSKEILQAKEDLMKSIQTFLKKFNRISFRETPKVLLLAWEKFFEIQYAQPEDIQELLHKLLKDLQIIREELDEYINSPSWNHPAFYNDDDNEEYTIQYREYLENSSNAITPDLLTEEPDNSLSMDEHLDTIPKTESDEVIKSSVKDLVPIPSESEGIFNMCDVPSCDKKYFDAESDLMESLLNCDTPIVYSPKIDSLLDKFAEEDISLIEQLLYDDYASSDDDTFYSEDNDYVKASPPNSELVSLEEVKDLDTKDGEIDTDILLTIKDDILREKLRNINILIAKIKSLNDNPTLDFVLKSYSSFPIPKNSGSTTVHADISLSEYDSFQFEIEPDQGELTRVMVEDISDNSSRELYVHVPNVLPTLPTLEDRHYLFLTYVIRLFLPYFTYPVDSPFLLSSGSEDTIFDLGISAFHFYSLELEASHRSGTFICFNDCPDFKGSRAVFCLSSLRTF
ncbi:hypothetical protein Tco_0549197 [Tanacetum coccineum]